MQRVFPPIHSELFAIRITLACGEAIAAIIISIPLHLDYELDFFKIA